MDSYKEFTNEEYIKSYIETLASVCEETGADIKHVKPDTLLLTRFKVMLMVEAIDRWIKKKPQERFNLVAMQINDYFEREKSASEPSPLYNQLEYMLCYSSDVSEAAKYEMHKPLCAAAFMAYAALIRPLKQIIKQNNIQTINPPAPPVSEFLPDWIDQGVNGFDLPREDRFQIYDLDDARSSRLESGIYIGNCVICKGIDNFNESLENRDEYISEEYQSNPVFSDNVSDEYVLLGQYDNKTVFVLYDKETRYVVVHIFCVDIDGETFHEVTELPITKFLADERIDAEIRKRVKEMFSDN